MRRIWIIIAIGLPVAGSPTMSLCQCRAAAQDETCIAVPATETPATNAPAKLPETKKKGGEFTWSKTTFRLGMTMTEAMAEIRKSPKEHWYAVELDTHPYDELHKMDNWVLSYNNPSDPEQGGGGITLLFANGKLMKIQEGEAQ